MNQNARPAWDAFWSQRRGGSGGCLPDSSPGLEIAQRAAWQTFAGKVVPNGRVLDLATGDGRVMAWLLNASPRLDPVGVDLAAALPPPPPGTMLQPGVAMEDLPFPDAAFDAVVSQFGFEYGDIPKVATEIRRVIRSDGVVGLMTHRVDGPILAHNLARLAAIRWAVEEEDLPGKAQRSLALWSADVETVPTGIAEAPAQGQAKFGIRSAAWEIAEAIRRTMELGRADRPQRVAEAVDAIRTMAENEMARILALESACRGASNDRTRGAALGNAGLVEVDVAPIAISRESPPFADFRTIRIG